MGAEGISYEDHESTEPQEQRAPIVQLNVTEQVSEFMSFTNFGWNESEELLFFLTLPEAEGRA